MPNILEELGICSNLDQLIEKKRNTIVSIAEFKSEISALCVLISDPNLIHSTSDQLLRTVNGRMKEEMTDLHIIKLQLQAKNSEKGTIW